MVDDFILLTGTSNLDLAKQVGEILKKTVHETVTRFADGEARVIIPENIRRKKVFIIQSTCPPVDGNLMELFLMIDAARRASASEIIAVIPYFGYSRQDRHEKSGTPVSSSLIANFIEHAGASKIITLDIHSKIKGVKIPIIDLSANSIFVEILESQIKDTKNLVVVSPDKGGVLRAASFAKLLNVQKIAIVYKMRDIQKENISRAIKLEGEVTGKDILIVDDMIDTGGTILGALELLQKSGAKSISALVTHGLFSGSAMEKIQRSVVKEILVTDTVPQIPNKKIQVVSVAKLLADEILE